MWIGLIWTLSHFEQFKIVFGGDLCFNSDLIQLHMVLTSLKLDLDRFNVSITLFWIKNKRFFKHSIKAL